MIDESTEELAALYVLGLLPADEAAALEAKMAGNPELARLVAGLEIGASALAYTVPPVQPSPALKARVMQAIRPATTTAAPRAGHRSQFPWALVASIAVLCGAGVSYYSVHALNEAKETHRADVTMQQDLQERLLAAEAKWADLQARSAANGAAADTAKLETQRKIEEAANEIGVLRAKLNSAQQEMVALQARDNLSQLRIAMLTSQLHATPRATAVVAWDEDNQRGIVRTSNIPAARPDQDYQLWIIDPEYKQPVSAGTMQPQADARPAEFKPLQPIKKASKFAVSLEKKGGSDSPQGPIVLMGE